jgi:Transposase DDE domain
MSAQLPLYQTILDRIAAAVPPSIRRSAITRLALLTTGILAAKSTVLAQVAAELHALELTDATAPEHVERGLRRTLNDPLLQPHTCYHPVLGQVLDWAQLLRGSRQVVLSVDDSTKTDQIHLFRASLTYWGGSLPLAWAVWDQNVAQPQGHYWQQVDHVFDQGAVVLPEGLRVVVVADRAFAVPNFIDRCAKRGWSYVVRLTTTGSPRFRDQRGRESELRALVGRHLRQPGQRWKASGELFKGAGWRKTSVVGLWGQAAKEPLVVLSDLGAKWAVLGLYERRFWCEPSFRNDKSRGWEWERSQVVGVEHNKRLVLAMAWASLVAVCVGLDEAQARMERERAKRGRGGKGQVEHARESLFTLGLRGVRRWLYGTARGKLPWRVWGLDGESWQRRWHRCQASWLIFGALAPG